jgi:hypothetical protein
MSRFCQGKDLLWRISDEQLLPRNADALPSMGSIDLARMGLKPSEVALEKFPPGLCFGDFLGISDQFHRDRTWLRDNHRYPQKYEH